MEYSVENITRLDRVLTEACKKALQEYFEKERAAGRLLEFEDFDQYNRQLNASFAQAWLEENPRQ